MPRRTARARPDPVRAQVAAQRLAQLAAGLGVTDPALRVERNEQPGGQQGVQQGRQQGRQGEAIQLGEPEWWADHTRVSGGDEPAPTNPGFDEPRHLPPTPAPPLLMPPIPALPVPGRHAARRRPAILSALRGSLRDRVPALAPVHVAVVAVVVALGLALTTWWVLRDRPESIRSVSAQSAEPLVPSATSSATTSPTPSASGSAESSPTAASGEATVTVDVAGKVRRPGIVVLDQGARVTDALAQAGGARQGVDLTSINLARILVDGEQIVVGGPPGAGAPAAAGAAPAGADGPLVNLNLASAVELESLPQVGPVTAQAIVAWREEHGGFTRIDELLEIDGIGEKTLERLKPHVTV